ncbi:transportin-3 [Achroia grisella]|uniref:transportin-3 n=1 Tax=Achroia grisella TaxID=688607 RepID=UPI0027D1F7CC|nr:transportin-3 [Achroia grisella]
MEVPSMDTIYQAISALYDNPNVTEKEKASLWLGDIQKSIHSWKIADELLQQKRDVQSCYFAAQTMRSKVQHNLSELPSEAVVSLRDSLVDHLERTSPETSNAILTQLCLALADLALQMTGWQNCTGDLIKKFSNKNDFALLEILTVLPQEIDSSSLKLGENRRDEIKLELRSNSHIVTSFLKESIINSQDTVVSLKIVKCMTSWIQVRAIDVQQIPNNAVIVFCLQVLRDYNSINKLHEAASDCICALLHCLEENNNNENIERLLFESVSALEESYHMAVAHEDEEKAANYAKVFTELAETFLEKIIAATASGNTHFAMRSLELALVCVGHHDYEIAEMTFNLWYRLSEEVYQGNFQPLTDVFKPHVERLIEALARHCQCEPDHTHLPEEGDEFHEFRIKVMGLIKDVVFIIGSSSVFRQMFAALHADISWEQTEAALFVMQAVAKNILPEEYEYVPKVVEAILSMPENTHIGVRKTCILLLGELCEWIERHPEGLEPCLQFLIRALNDSQLAPAAATALQAVCAASRTRASEHVRLLLDAASLPLPPAPAVAVARGLAAAIGRLPHPQVCTHLRQLQRARAAAAGRGQPAAAARAGRRSRPRTRRRHRPPPAPTGLYSPPSAPASTCGCCWTRPACRCRPRRPSQSPEDSPPPSAASRTHRSVLTSVSSSEHVRLLLDAASLPLPPAPAVAVARGLAAAIGRLPHPQLSAAMLEAVEAQTERLEALLAAAGEAAGAGGGGGEGAVRRGAPDDPCPGLDRIAALFRDVAAPPAPPRPHPCLPALRHAWPVLLRLLARFGADGRVMERWCRAVRFCVRAVGGAAGELVQPLAAAAAALYAARPHPCLLYLGSVLVDELAAAPGPARALLELLSALAPRALHLLQPPHGLRDNPDTVDDLFRLCIRFLQRTPEQFLSSGALPAVVRCAALACSLDHREANCSVMKFLHDLVRAASHPRPDHARVTALASEVITRYGEDITYALIESSVLHLHSYMLAEVAEVLLELLQWQKAAGVDWLQPSLQKLPRDRSATATEQQCWQFHQYAMSAEKCKELTRILRDFARLYR